MLKKAIITAVSALTAAILFAVPANAEPGDNPCQLAVTFLCKFVPLAPDLEGDVDLTKDQPPADPNAPPPESLPVAPICAAGCI